MGDEPEVVRVKGAERSGDDNALGGGNGMPFAD